MDQITLVDRRISDGQKLVLQLVQDGFDVAASFWLKAADDDFSHLFIASKLVDQEGPGEAYRSLQESQQKLPGICISMADVKLIGAHLPIATEVRRLQKQSGTDRPLQYRGLQLGNLSAEDVYVYPLFSRQKGVSYSLGKLRLKTDVKRNVRLKDLVAPQTPQDRRAMEQLIASGLSPGEADYWIRKRREIELGAIPAGTLVDAHIVTWWGDNPEEDPNPLLRVVAPDGAEGLTLKNNTEPA